MFDRVSAYSLCHLILLLLAHLLHAFLSSKRFFIIMVCTVQGCSVLQINCRKYKLSKQFFKHKANVAFFITSLILSDSNSPWSYSIYHFSYYISVFFSVNTSFTELSGHFRSLFQYNRDWVYCKNKLTLAAVEGEEFCTQTYVIGILWR